MTIAFVTGASETSTSTTNRVVPAPASIVAGNLLIAILSGHNVFTISGRPAGWNNVLIQNQAADQTLAIEYKIATAGDVGMTAGTWTLNTASAGIEAMLQYSGTAGSATVIHQAAGTTTANGTIHATPSIVTTVNGCMIFSAFSQDVAASVSWTQAGENERFDAFDVNFFETTAGYDSVQASGGTISKTGISTASDAGLAFIVALAPAAGGSYNLATTPGTYNLSGVPPNLEKGWFLGASPGGYNLSGLAVGLQKGKTLSASVGIYNLTGVPINARRTYRIPPNVGSYSLAGISPTLKHGYEISPPVGSYSLTGISPRLLHGFEISPSVGAYTLSGISPRLLHGYEISPPVGSYSLTGTPPRLLRGYRIILVPGLYSLTGLDVILTKSGGGPAHYTMTVNPGAYGSTGIPIRLLWARIFSVSPGAYSLTGNPGRLLLGHKLSVSPGSYSLTGVSPSGLLFGRRLSLVPGSYILTGKSVNFPYMRRMMVSPGAYSLTGIPVSLILTGLGFPYTPTVPVIIVSRGTISALGSGIILVERDPISPDPDPPIKPKRGPINTEQ